MHSAEAEWRLEGRKEKECDMTTAKKSKMVITVRVKMDMKRKETRYKTVNRLDRQMIVALI
jgi:hypothetical protein